MYLKRLELLGFKSFPDKTVIKLTGGVIGVVGPNGCGKTNILDSIRWVLGEQKVSLLRGTKMEEIIFNGTRDIKPLGMAEVTLVIQNSKGILPTEYSEVQITRRLFRSGEAEYLLNKIPCRLKDIADLLMDTGIGAHVYSVIQQDMIDAILSDRTDDRRFLFEEAAGISKYKNRKKAALRKLEATEQDLLRLKDIVAEVTVQVNSLNRQMKKAERYQKMAEELKGWEIFLGKNASDTLQNERRALMTRRDSLLDARVACDAAIDTLSAQQEEQRKELTDLDRELTAISNLVYEKSEAAHALEKEISILREKRENARQLQERNTFDIQAFQKRKEILAEQIEETRRELEKVESESGAHVEEVARSEQNLNEADEKVLAARRARDELSKELMALEGRLSAGKSDDSNLKEQESDINTSLTELIKLHSEAGNNRDKIAARLAELESSGVTIAAQISGLQNQQNTWESEIRGFDARLEELSGEIFDLTASLEAAEARRHLLSEMITHYEGYSAGVVTTFENRERWPGLIGTVAEHLTPHGGFEDAIEAALGETAEFMISRDRETADGVISFLRQEKKGKAGLIILNEAGFNTGVTRPELNGESFLGWADQYVTVSEELKPLAHLLLSRIAVIKPENNKSILDALPMYFAAVTTDGKLFENRAIVSGGSNEGLSLFGRKEKIAEQDRILQELNGKIAEIKTARNQITSELGSKQAELHGILSQLDNLKEESDRVHAELTSTRYEMQTVETEMRRLEKEKKAFSDKLELLKSRQYDLSLNYDQLAREKETLVGRLQEHEMVIGQLERDSEEAQNRLSSVQIRQIELRSKKQQLESQIRHTGELIAEIEQNATAKSQEIVSAEQEITGSLDRIAGLEKELKELFDARAVLADKQNGIRNTYSGLQENLVTREKEIKQQRQTREEALEELHAAELRMTAIEAEVRNITEKIRNDYDLELEAITAEPPDSRLPEEKRLERLHELKDLMKNFGGVNLLALEEYRTSKERQEFLSAQMNDLLNAKSTLQSTITKINVTAKNLFMETFARVRENFKKVFEELFTGGDADIRLLDEADPLESPIEIIARPRGKKLLSIAQMSGGERALTAISLLFAIYLVKPSPFCILDEIDAPLDDANIHRFLRMIKAFSDQTQFIIITHNKITMEAADVLYGVTMEQPGISRVVSVRFNEEADESLINTSIAEADYTPVAHHADNARTRVFSDSGNEIPDDPGA